MWKQLQSIDRTAWVIPVRYAVAVFMSVVGVGMIEHADNPLEIFAVLLSATLAVALVSGAKAS